MTSTNMNTLYRKLGTIGFNKKFVKSIIPDWWDSELENSEAALIELQIQLSKNLNINFKSLASEEKLSILNNQENCKFKKRQNTSIDSLAPACALATSIAKLAITATSIDYNPLPDAAEVRRQILANGSENINFSNLLNYLWEHGIPVIHISRLPTGNKMEGLAFEHQNRPAIILAGNKKMSAWQLFILAHEAGHIAHEHIHDGPIIDEKINEENEEDAQELEANQYAIELLTGNKKSKLHSNGKLISGRNLAKIALEYGKEHQIYPGHVVLNHANTQHKHYEVPAAAAYGSASGALKIIDNIDFIKETHNKIKEHIDPNLISEDSYDYLLKVTGIE
ncbi:ImmA/IrrE family metallo-endopeptidase [Vreelandella titanicae]|uniref:ImmA/IrrE family metallo-endopeptidase n=1 Tax=Vreelandella titanicae TaxID=664683 RepID=UPI003FD6C5AD|tara:strand:+ start:4467 stop:5477 length:1011 start_codon:yes stop_codon:yes gene_type:complete